MSIRTIRILQQKTSLERGGGQSIFKFCVRLLLAEWFLPSRLTSFTRWRTVNPGVSRSWDDMTIRHAAVTRHTVCSSLRSECGIQDCDVSERRAAALKLLFLRCPCKIWLSWAQPHVPFHNHARRPLPTNQSCLTQSRLGIHDFLINYSLGVLVQYPYPTSQQYLMSCARQDSNSLCSWGWHRTNDPTLCLYLPCPGIPDLHYHVQFMWL